MFSHASAPKHQKTASGARRWKPRASSVSIAEDNSEVIPVSLSPSLSIEYIINLRYALSLSFSRCASARPSSYNTIRDETIRHGARAIVRGSLRYPRILSYSESSFGGINAPLYARCITPVTHSAK